MTVNTKFLIVGMATFLLENGIEIVKQSDEVVNDTHISSLYVIVSRLNRNDEDIDYLMRMIKVQYTLCLIQSLKDDGFDINKCKFEAKVKYKIREP